MERYDPTKFRDSIINKMRIGFLIIDNPEQDFVNESIKLMNFKHSSYIKFFLVTKADKNDDELKKLILFSIMKPVDFIILYFDYGLSKLVKFRDPSIPKDKLVEKVLRGKQEQFLYKQKPQKFKFKMFPKLTRDNLMETINDTSKHVVVAYVTPWCSYCKEVYDMYKKVHKHLHAHVRDFIFATIDYMANDLDLKIENFPTILIYPKHDKKNPIVYDMIRDYDVFLTFLE